MNDYPIYVNFELHIEATAINIAPMPVMRRVDKAPNQPLSYTQEEPISTMYALLIGVDFYYPDALPEGVYYPSLGGCVRDIRHVEAYLTNQAKVPETHILKLTSTNTGGSHPAEPAEQLPTRSNIIAKFRQLAAMAQPGDQVYIHYSGHGGRAKTAYADLKGSDGQDEALVPPDIGKPGRQYLRDVELAYLLQEMVDKNLLVTVVLDSCHSGGATRGRGDAVARGVDKLDKADRPTDDLVAPVATLLASWQRMGGATRGVKPASGWLLEPKGYVLFAACRANEAAFEYAFDGSERNGALTYWLLDSLRNAGSGYSYKMLHDRIVAKVHGQFERQTPQLQGESNLALFGGDVIKPYFAVPVLEVSGNRVRVNAGEAHLVAKDDYFAIYPTGPDVDFAQANQRRALVKVQQVQDVDAWAEVESGLGGSIEVGDQAVYLPGDNVRLQRNAAILIKDMGLHQEVSDAIELHGQRFIAVAGPEEQLDFQINLDQSEQYYEIWDPAGVAIPKLGSPLPIADATSLPKLVNRLVHLAKYRNIQSIDMPDARTRKRLHVELTGSIPSSAPRAGHSGSDATDDTPTYHVGDRLTLSIKNTQTPGAAGDPTLVLNIAILTLESDWSITQIYPIGAAFESVDPGKTIPLEFEAYLPEGQTESTTTFMIFATEATTDFRWLQLAALDQPDIPRSSKRSGISDILTQLLASVTSSEANTRTFKLVASPQQNRGWTVERIKLHVEQ